jgi:hypothetical protein
MDYVVTQPKLNENNNLLVQGRRYPLKPKALMPELPLRSIAE